MNDNFKDNHYIAHFNKCFDILDSNERFEYISERADILHYDPVKLSWWDKLTMSKRKKEELESAENDVEIVSSKDALIEEFDTEIDSFMKKDFEPSTTSDIPGKNIIRSFEQIWYFAQFVRYAEKVIFYENIPAHAFYVDSGLNDDKERCFVIDPANTEYSILFKLQWVYDTTKKEMLKVINIKVTRDYGKQMINEYTIVNGEVNLNDDSDYTLIKVINSILYDYTLNTYKCIMNDLLDFFERRMTYPCRA